MYAIVPMYFTHTYTHLYIKHTLKVLVICSICGRNWGFSFQFVIIMKTVEKENYDCLWQSFTERLEEGKKVSQAYPASTKQGKEQNHSLLGTQKKRGKKRMFYNCDKKCMCLQH